MTKKDAVAETPGTDLATMNFEEDSGAGFEAMDSSDMAIPFVSILQKLSPQCDKKEEKYIEGAEEGMFMNTVTNELFDGDKGITVVPCFYERVVIEWKPKRGGISAIHPKDTPLLMNTEKNEKNQDVLGNGNVLSPTAQFYCLVIKESKIDKVLISMSSTALKVARRWNRAMGTMEIQGKNGMFIPPIFSQKYKLTTVQESNAEGSWMNWQEEFAGMVDDPAMYATAKDFYKEALAGKTKVAQQSEETPF